MTMWSETGHASLAERAQEARKRVDAIANAVEEMEPNERKFVEDVGGRLDATGDATFVSAKQLFWLRDLDEKYS